MDMLGICDSIVIVTKDIPIYSYVTQSDQPVTSLCWGKDLIRPAVLDPIGYLVNLWCHHLYHIQIFLSISSYSVIFYKFSGYLSAWHILWTLFDESLRMHWVCINSNFMYEIYDYCLHFMHWKIHTCYILTSDESCLSKYPLRWRHNDCNGISNHQPHGCLLSCLIRHRSKKTSNSMPLAFVRGIHWWPVNSPHKGPVTRKKFPFDDVIMT